MFASKDELFTRPSGGYTIGKSVRLRSSASAYLNRTPASTTNQKTWTWSGWVKRGALSSGSYMDLFSALSGANDFTEFRYHYNTNDDTLVFSYVVAGTGYYVSSTNVFRDPSAWYHLVCSIDTTQATAANRVKIYVNGVQVSYATTGYPPQNSNTSVNATNTQNIGNINTYGRYFDGYLTEINFIDGQQLTPSSFGSTNALTGVWQPVKYTGTYGTNGFYLNFSSNGTAAALGTDFSGNSNTWTVNNISVTAGTTYDSMTDVPTLTSATAANYCVLNPLDKGAGVIGAGNLSWQYTTSGAHAGIRASMDMLGGNWYFEGTYTEGSTAGSSAIGIALSTWSLATYAGDTGSWSYHANGNKYVNGTGSAYGATYTTGDVIGIAFNSSTGTLTGYKNGTSQGTIVSGLSVTSYFSAVSSFNSSAWAMNFGQRPFSYTPPTGYVALNTYNLPTSTITNGAAYMAATLYTGNLTGQSITNTASNASFQPDLVWVKSRSAATDNKWTDSVRGATKALISNSTAAETTDATGVTALNSNGFTVGASTDYNNTGATYVGWQWKAGGTSSSNTNGSITSTVSSGATQGFSVVTYTGTGANATVGHGLGVAPSMIICKSRSSAYNWVVYHVSLGNTANLKLNTTDAQTTGATTSWNSTSPTSTVFSLGSSLLGNDTNPMVAYCFAAVAGFSAFGSYTGNGSADGPFVYCGFRPRFVLLKDSTNAGNNWQILDTSRDTYNVAPDIFQANLSNAESAFGTGGVDFLSNGFKIRTSSTSINTTSAVLIYACFAENPFRNALAR